MLLNRKKSERGRKKADLKVNLSLFTVYSVPFLVVLSFFFRMEDFLLVSVPVVIYSGRNFVGERSIDLNVIAGKLFRQTKYV